MIGTADGQELGRSSSAAVTAISQVIPSRILMSVRNEWCDCSMYSYRVLFTAIYRAVSV